VAISTYARPDLLLKGPYVKAVITLGEPAYSNTIRRNREMPKTICVQALVDTGASICCITKDIVDSLGLLPRDTVKVLTPSSEDERPLYEIAIAIPDLSTTFLFIDAVLVTLSGQPHQALIGRNVLQHLTMIYRGPSNEFELHY
jgi:predicted aspartyl protease